MIDVALTGLYDVYLFKSAAQVLFAGQVMAILQVALVLLHQDD